MITCKEKETKVLKKYENNNIKKYNSCQLRNKIHCNVLPALRTYHSVTVRGMVGSDTVKEKIENK